MEVEFQTDGLYAETQDAIRAPVFDLLEPIQQALTESCPPWYHYGDPNGWPEGSFEYEEFLKRGA